ncbi:hypothetical protein AAFF_G00218630 [Aldrovandia affinis]|uniref:Uncharacterized protein n=1 Tax=Aldrovandia affinis TaxID=143900 RepID=A0AAD7SVY0_9TELE|nr:hypothetical protein AAFF_G00218630 [Aldrovandia affinis]
MDMQEKVESRERDVTTGGLEKGSGERDRTTDKENLQKDEPQLTAKDRDEQQSEAGVESSTDPVGEGDREQAGGQCARHRRNVREEERKEGHAGLGVARMLVYSRQTPPKLYQLIESELQTVRKAALRVHSVAVPVCSVIRGADIEEECSPRAKRVFGQEWSFSLRRDGEPTAVEEVITPLQSSLTRNQVSSPVLFTRNQSADMEEVRPESLLIKQEGLEEDSPPTAVEEGKKQETAPTPAGDPEELSEQHRCGHSDEELSGLEFVVKAEQEEEHVAQRPNQTACEHSAGRLNNLGSEYVMYERDSQLWTSFTQGDSDIETDDRVCSNATEQHSQSLSVHTELQHAPATMEGSGSTLSSFGASYVEVFDKMSGKQPVYGEELRSEAIHTQQEKEIESLRRKVESLESERRTAKRIGEQTSVYSCSVGVHLGINFRGKRAVECGADARERPPFENKLFEEDCPQSTSAGEEQVAQCTPVEEGKKQETEPTTAGDPEELSEQHRCGHSDEELSGLEFVVKAEQEEEHTQLASIMEVLAKAAVAEISKLVEDGSVELHLEVSRSHKEIDGLRRKLQQMESELRTAQEVAAAAPGSRSVGVQVEEHLGRAERGAVENCADAGKGPSFEQRLSEEEYDVEAHDTQAVFEFTVKAEQEQEEEHVAQRPNQTGCEHSAGRLNNLGSEYVIQTENQDLKKKLQLMERELRVARGRGRPNAAERVGQELNLSLRRDREPTAAEERTTPLQSSLTRSQSVDMEEVRPESFLIKQEGLEDDSCYSDPPPTSAGEEQVTQPTPAGGPEEQVAQCTAVEEGKKQETASTRAGDPEELSEQHRCGHSDEELSGLEFVVKAEQEEEHVSSQVSTFACVTVMMV